MSGEKKGKDKDVIGNSNRSPASGGKRHRWSLEEFVEKGSDSGEAPSLESAPPKPLRRGKPKE